MLSVVLVRFISRRALRPIHDMVSSVEMVDSSTLGCRLVVPNTGDDVERLYVSFNELLTRLEESFERQRCFTRDASHQFRTPLAAILGQIEIALRRDRSAEEYRGTMTLIQQKTNHLAKLIESLLFLARTESSSTNIDLESVDLSRLISEVVNDFGNRGRRIELNSEADLPTMVKSHGVLMKELFSIVIDNACTYSNSNSLISVCLASRGDEIAIEVEDRGDGMDAEELNRVFQPFVRLPGALGRQKSGLGLGLSIAQRISDLLNARLQIRSVKGMGTVVTIYLRAPNVSAVQVEALRTIE